MMLCEPTEKSTSAKPVARWPTFGASGCMTGNANESAAATERARMTLKRLLGTGYIMVMALCGMVAVLSGSTLEDLASNCGKTSTEVGLVFIMRGIGAAIGSTLSSQTYPSNPGNTVVSVTMLVLAAVLIYMPFITSVYVLYLSYLLLGVVLAVINTGCQIMTQKLHGPKAGKWLGYNNASLGMAGVLMPLIECATGSLFAQYAILCGSIGLLAAYITILPAPEKCKGLIEDTSEQRAVRARDRSQEIGSSELSWWQALDKYRVELHISAMFFCAVGAKATATSYLESYVEDTGVIDPSQEVLLLVDLWVGIAVGLTIGLLDLKTATLRRLYRHTSVVFVGGALAVGATLVFDKSSLVLWMGIAAFGLCNGPTSVYCYDLQRRITDTSETGISLVMFGVNFGPCIIPYAFSLVDEITKWPKSLIVMLMVVHILPFLLILNTKRRGKDDGQSREDYLLAGSSGSSTTYFSTPHDESTPLLEKNTDNLSPRSETVVLHVGTASSQDWKLDSYEM